MVITLFQCEMGEDTSPLPDHFEYYVEDDWVMASFPMDDGGTYQITPLVQDALAAGDFQKVMPPYREKDSGLPRNHTAIK